MKLAVALLVLGACGAHSWTASDLALESAFAAATVTDGLQSRTFVDHCHEMNPVIGNCGQNMPLGAYIPLSILVHAGITWALPKGAWRTTFLALTTGAELDTIYSNTFLKDGH